MMPKAIVYLRVAYEVECTPELMARMMDSSEDGMGPFYPSENRWEAWEKLARWIGLDQWTPNQLDGIADFPAEAASARRTDCELDEVNELAHA